MAGLKPADGQDCYKRSAAVVDRVTVVDTARDLGVVLDRQLSLAHVTAVVLTGRPQTSTVIGGKRSRGTKSNWPAAF